MKKIILASCLALSTAACATSKVENYHGFAKKKYEYTAYKRPITHATSTADLAHTETSTRVAHFIPVCGQCAIDDYDSASKAKEARAREHELMLRGE